MRPVIDDVKGQPSGASEREFVQPYLHELAIAVHAPGVALSAPDGQLEDGVHGLFWGDRRLLSRLVVGVDGERPVGIETSAAGPGAVRFLGVLRRLGDRGADPTVTLQRERTVVDGGMVETITVRSAAREHVRAVLEVEAGCDLLDMSAAKAGTAGAPLPAEPAEAGLSWRAPDGSTVTMQADPPPDRAGASTLRWPVSLGPGASTTVTVRVGVRDAAPPVVLPSRESVVASEGFSVRCDDRRLSELVARSTADLADLCLADPLDEYDQFLAAGAPWFLTLFGRDAIWAARMLLPLGTALAAGTLRTLARRQGTEIDPASAQEPGKIMHEIRAGETSHQSEGFRLPPLYYGTVDATALWVSLLHDAWRWGMPAAEVAALLPNVRRAMGWILDHGTAANGLVSYRDASGHGLANQGWKDSGDSVQFRDGRLATPPIALCEVQGYCFAAAGQAIELFEAFGVPPDPRWRPWADALADRFRASFWVPDAGGAYPAIALDADGVQVDSLTSNVAHLLGTGLLSAAEEQRVVARVGRPELSDAFGLRTMSSGSTGFNPLAYHGGSVWTHDTAIAVTGLAGVDSPAASALAVHLSEGLLAAAPGFGYRLPELFGGHARSSRTHAVPYPAACRPQAWSAASSLAMTSALLGLHADVPGRTLVVRPARPWTLGALEVRGLRFGEHTFDVSVDRDGDPVVHGLPPTVVVTIG